MACEEGLSSASQAVRASERAAVACDRSSKHKAGERGRKASENPSPFFRMAAQLLLQGLLYRGGGRCPARRKAVCKPAPLLFFSGKLLRGLVFPVRWPVGRSLLSSSSLPFLLFSFSWPSLLVLTIYVDVSERASG